MEILKLLKEKKELQSLWKSTKCKLAKTIFNQYIEDIEVKISEKVADENAIKAKEHLSELNYLDGKFSQSGLWKLKNALCPKPRDPPMAKKDPVGNLVTAPEQLKRLFALTYAHRLRHRKIAAKSIWRLQSQI